MEHNVPIKSMFHKFILTSPSFRLPMKFTNGLLALCIVSLTSCNQQPRKTAEALFKHAEDGLPKYDLKAPTSKYFLPYVLEEISGLSYVRPGVLACVQDEEGKMFFYNHENRILEKDLRFGKAGDYEGVEIVGDTAYVIKSNGTIFKFDFGEGFDLNNVREIKTKLKKPNDVEGLAFDRIKNDMIIACKGKAGLKKDEKMKGRAFYKYDLKKDKLDKEPKFRITKKDIKKFLETHNDFQYEESRINFHPSGIAHHPHRDLFYIIASTGKLMIIADRKGNIKGTAPLDPRLFGQPEGICFAPNGDLFISSEGQGDKGYILKFRMK